VNPDSCDILIAGGGMAGASLALALRGYPGRIAVLDQQFAAHATSTFPTAGISARRDCAPRSTL
jgi:2-polyprenyl-6-methoxyphenol hydroxylase-like FAD-dependent oxidoreductase